MQDVAQLLEQTLTEEKQTDAPLTLLAYQLQVNPTRLPAGLTSCTLSGGSTWALT